MPGHSPISEYALIGNRRTAALVSRRGAIDWYCGKRFDGDAVFCRLLDQNRGGFIEVAPEGLQQCRRRYVRDTNVVELEFESRTGTARAQYFMPLSSDEDASNAIKPWIVVKLACTGGEVDVAVRFKPTPDWGRSKVRLEVRPGAAIAHSDREVHVLATDVPLVESSPGVAQGVRRLRSGESLWVVLRPGGDGAPHELAPVELERMFERTVAFWREWLRQCVYDGPHAPLVRRSALVLKLLIYAPTGATVAAPTTSLPENLGGVRNWDYRFSWARDSALIVYALQRLGFHEDAMALWRWLAQLQWTGDDLQIMYGIDGRADLEEICLEHLCGYADSKPVRIGNAAYLQRQADIYGEVLDSAEFCEREMGMDADDTFWDLICRLARRVEQIWREPDRGIWEVRGKPRHFVHSKVMCWVALERASKIARRIGHPDRSDAWGEQADRIREEILEHGVDERGVFTQSYGSGALDASILLLPTLGFISANDPRMRSTVEAICSELMSDGLLLRYLADDGLPGREGAFLLCTLWLVDVLALQGRVAEARRVFDRVAAFANDVGLLAEEADPSTGEQLGNFPQGFSHVGLIRSALLLSAAQRRGEGRPAPGHEMH